MLIEIKYSRSQGSHKYILSRQELENCAERGELAFSEPTPKGEKTLVFQGTPSELRALAEGLLKAAK